MKDLLESHLTGEQRQILRGLDTPRKIQDYLDATPYSPEYANRCPLQVMNDRIAHCLDGALFAAAALAVTTARCMRRSSSETWPWTAVRVQSP